MTQLPDELEYGFVRSRILLAVADTPADEDHYPDAQAAQGTVRFTPSRSVIRGADEPVFVIKRGIDVDIAEDADTAAEIRKGDLIHNGRPGVWLVTGTYTVRFQLGDVSIEPFQIHVTPEHTEAAPLWLSLQAPLVPSPDVKFVVNEQVYRDTLAASESAQSSASDAESSANAAQVAADRAEAVPQDLATATSDGIMSADHFTKVEAVPDPETIATRTYADEAASAVAVYESGLRSVPASAFVPGSAAAVTSTPKLWRSGNTVNLALGDLTVTPQASTGGGLFTIPDGFKPHSSLAWVRLFIQPGSGGNKDGPIYHAEIPASYDVNGGALRVMRYWRTPLDGNVRVGGLVSWPTHQPPPSILPFDPA